mgnify:CR=1 FL=1
MAGNIAFYKLFTSNYCRNCPPVKKYLSNFPLTGEEIDVSTDLGINVSRQYNILSTPTVLFFDDKENLLGQAHSVEELKSRLQDQNKVLA